MPDDGAGVPDNGAGVPDNGAVLGTTLLVVSLGVTDSINPVTIAIAIYLAATPDPLRRLAGYAAGVFTTYLAGGLILVVGPGELLRTAVAGSHTRGFELASLLIGSLVIVLAIVLWMGRRRLTRVTLPAWALQAHSSFALGAGVTAVDLLTAFPYFGALGAIVSSGLNLVEQVLLLVVFNALYVLPLLAVMVAHALYGERAEAFLARGRATIERLSPVVLSLLTLGAGVALVVRGVSGLAG